MHHTEALTSEIHPLATHMLKAPNNARAADLDLSQSAQLSWPQMRLTCQLRRFCVRGVL